jgi:hypothetical protein
MVPHLAAREAHQRLWEFSIAAPKRLLQLYLPTPDIVPKVAIRSEADLAWRYRQRKNAAKELSMVRKPIPIFVIVYLWQAR